MSLLADDDKRVLIQDGYNLTRTFPATAKRPAVKITYRPAMPATVYGFLQHDETTGDGLLKKSVRLLMRHLVTWDVKEKKNPADDPVAVPITPETLARVPHDLLQQMASVIVGYAAEEAAEDEKNF